MNSLHSKISEVNDILKLNLFEFFSINETKLDASKPVGFYINNRFNIIRRDRCHGSTDLATKGGGIIIFIKKQYHIEYSFISDEYELIHIKLKIDNKLFNFICSYKSPKVNQSDFIEYLENYILNINMSEPLFIVGDLNMNIMLNENGSLESVVGYRFLEFIEKY